MATGEGPLPHSRWSAVSPWWGAALVAALALATCVPLLRLPLLADDYPNLLHPWNFVAAASPLFRPLESAVLATERLWFGGAPLPMHAWSLALHAGCVMAAYGVTVRWAAAEGRLAGRAVPAGLIAAVAFLLDPRAIQAVAWPSAVGDLAYALAFFGAVLAWPRRPWATALLYLLGLCAKEAAIVLPAALLIADQVAGRGYGWRRLAPVLAVGAAFGLFEAVRPAVLTALGDRAVFVWAVTGGYHLVGGRLLLRNLAGYPALTVFPWLHQGWALTRGRTWPLGALALCVLARWIAAGGLRRAGALWLLVTALPPMLFAPYDISDLYLYLPAFGLAVALAEEVLVRRSPRGHAATAVAAGVLVVVLGLDAVGWVVGERAWLRGGALFSREAAAVVAAARAHPHATIAASGLTALDGEVYIWLDAIPYAALWLDPSFAGRVIAADGHVALCAARQRGAVTLAFLPGTGTLEPLRCGTSA